MYVTKKNLDAQALDKWVAPENRLTPDEIIIEGSYHRFLESLNRPKPSPMALALVAVLVANASPCAHGRIGK